MTTTSDFTIYQGEDVILEVTITDQSGVIKDLTSASVSFRIGDTRAQSFVFEKAGTVSDGSNGVVQVSLTDVDTNALSVQTHNYQFIITDANSKQQTVKAGIVNVKFTLPTS